MHSQFFELWGNGCIIRGDALLIESNQIIQRLENRRKQEIKDRRKGIPPTPPNSNEKGKELLLSTRRGGERKGVQRDGCMGYE